MFAKGSDFYWLAGFGVALALGYCLPALAELCGVHRSLGTAAALISSVCLGRHCA